MKCDNCSINVTSEFTFALKTNQCPACGKNIMQADRMAAFLSLKTLLSKSFSSIDVEGVVNLVITNFDIKQRFVEEPKAQGPVVQVEPEVAKQTTETVSEDVEEDDAESDKAFKEQQKKEAKAILQKMKQEVLGEESEEDMREEALAQAIAEKLGNANGLIGEDDNPVSMAVRSKMDFQREQTRKNVLDGSKGAFRRSG